jgi:hypothetical protein
MKASARAAGRKPLKGSDDAVRDELIERAVNDLRALSLSSLRTVCRLIYVCRNFDRD